VTVFHLPWLVSLFGLNKGLTLLSCLALAEHSLGFLGDGGAI